MCKVTVAAPKQITATTGDAARFVFHSTSSTLKAELVPQSTIVGEGFVYSDPIPEEGMWEQLAQKMGERAAEWTARGVTIPDIIVGEVTRQFEHRGECPECEGPEYVLALANSNELSYFQLVSCYCGTSWS